MEKSSFSSFHSSASHPSESGVSTTLQKIVNTGISKQTTQLQHSVILPTSNTLSAQIMPITKIAVEGTTKVAYLSPISNSKGQELSGLLKTAGTISATRSIKPKMVFGSVLSHVTPGNTSNSLQSQPPKNMTNLLLPVNISQLSSPDFSKHNINFKSSNFTLKFNNGNNQSKIPMTVLSESKDFNGTTLPPLHPIVNTSTLSGGSLTDGVKITENPDSAIITPIPKKDEVTINLPEKRKRPISNIIRSEKRMRKQSFTKTNNETFEMSYDVNIAGNTEIDKIPKKDKESDDDITLIQLFSNSNEENNSKPIILSDEVKSEVVKNLNRNGVEVIEKFEIHGRTIEGDKKNRENTCENTSIEIVEWDGKMGKVVGTTLKLLMNDFGFLLPPKKGNDNDSGDKENCYLTQSSSVSITPMSDKQIDESKLHLSESDKIFFTCINCGVHGRPDDFYNDFSCTESCFKLLETQRLKMLKTERTKLGMQVKNKRKQVQKKIGKDVKKLKDSDEKSDDNNDKVDKSSSKTKPSSDESNSSVVQDDPPPGLPWITAKNKFSWSKYLECVKARPAPIKLFKNGFPEGKNNFKIGMKLEAIDPNHPSQCCVMTVVDVIGYRMKLRFDGFPESHDYWVNADCEDIFPLGNADRSSRKIKPPPNHDPETFNWNNYLKACKATAAPKNIFCSRTTLLPTGFRPGMKLEAVDRKHSMQVCVATVDDVLDGRILVHFDSWDDIYDYWADVNSPYIHPVGWCHHNGHQLTPPNNYKGEFCWNDYLKLEGNVSAPTRAFKQRPPCGFKRGMKFEAVDKRLPQVIRVATVEDVKDHQLKIRFDGWPESHAYWVDDDSPDIHPVGWCFKTGHPLEPPITQDDLANMSDCGTFGCKGIGHIKGPKFATHNSASGCPYSAQNLSKHKAFKDRLAIKTESVDCDDIPTADNNKFEKIKIDRKLISFENKIPTDNSRQDVNIYGSEKNQKLEITNRISSKWQKCNNGQSEDEDDSKKSKKIKIKDEANYTSGLNSSHNISSGRSSYIQVIPDKQLRQELYESVYHPGYNPIPHKSMWVKHSPALNRLVTKVSNDPLRWSVEEVVKFVEALPNCQHIGTVFRTMEIDGDTFLSMCENDFINHLNLKFGHALKIYNSITLLREKALNKASKKVCKKNIKKSC